MNDFFVKEQIPNFVGRRLAPTDLVGTLSTTPLSEHVGKNRMLNTRCVCAVVFHIFELLDHSARLGYELAAIDEAFDTVLVVIPVVWPRD